MMTALDRRGVVGGTLGMMAISGLARAAGRQVSSLKFNVLRNGEPFGRYTVAFTVDGQNITAVTDVAMSARVAGLTVFDYRHHCEEIWQGGRLMEMRSHSIRDNQPDLRDAVVVARTDTGGLKTTTTAGTATLPPDAAPLTHWNRAVLQGPLFNPQTGTLLKLTAVPLGPQAVLFANGTRVNATRWQLLGETEINEWYDAQGTWVGLRGVLPDKSTLAYQRT